MNKIFKVIWSKSKQCYIVVSEIAKNKTGKKKIVVASILAALAMQSGMITDVMAADPPSARLADAAVAVGTNGVAIGSSAKSQSNQSVAIGYFSNAQAPTASPENPATAVGAGANANGAGTVALGLSANATGANAVALGGGSNGGKNKTEATAVETTAVGFNAKASNSRATAIGSGAASSGSDAIAFGTSTVANSEKAIAIGANSKGTAIGATALGRSSEATGASATALGSLASATGTLATAVGMQASASGNESLAIGTTASATSGRSLAVGTNSKATGATAVAVGSGSGGSGPLGFAGSLNSTAGVVNTNRTVNYATTAEGDNAVALGYYANAKNSGVAVGQRALAATGGVAIGKGVLEDTGNNYAGGVVIGQDSATLGPYSLAMGFNAFASGSTSMAIGHTVSADGGYAVAMGRKVSASGTSTAIGHHATATNGGLAIGSQENDASNDRTTASATGAVAIGKNAKATSEDAVAIGTNAQATLQGAVALGSGSTTATGATNQGSTTINGITYNFAGATGNPNMQVSVGSAGATRQIKNVAAGEVSATSTDAINGSQLYAVASAVKPLKYVSVNSAAAGTGSNVDNDGAQGGNSIAIGPSSTVTRQNGIAIGSGAQSLSEDSVVIGRDAKAETKTGAGLTTTSRAIVIGSNSRVAADVTQGVAIGSGLSPDEGAVVTGDQSIAIGGNVKVDGHSAIAIGGDDARKAANQLVSYTNTDDTEVTGTLQTAIQNLTGYNLSNYKGTTASHAGVAYGTSALAGNAGVAIGTAADSMTRMNDKGQVVNNKPVTNAVAIGTGARANFDNSVAIGGGSNTDHYATKQVNAVIDGVEVKWSGGENISPGDVVSFGAKGFERQLKNVAPGEVSQTSTDAVNGSQIYSLARKVTNIMNGGSGSVVNVNATGEPLSKVVTGTGASKVEKYYRTVDVKDDGTLVTGAVSQTPTSLALVNVDQTDTNKQTQTPRILGNVANGVKDNDAVNVSQLNAAKVKYFSVNSSDAGNINNDGATGTDAIAIGPSAVSNAVGSVALGKDAKANGDFTVALGGGNWQFKGAQANGVGTTALGSSTKTKVGTNYQTAIGFGATTSAESALALGYNAAASAQNAIALGRSASTAGQDAVALGSSSQAKGDSGLAIGNGAQANSNSVISLGYQANNGASNNTNGVAIGWAAGMQSNGLNNVGVGTNAGRQVIGNNNTSLGNGAGNIANTKIYTSESIMLGTGAKVVGSSATKSIDNVIAIGKNTSGSASSAIAVGINAGSSAENGVAIGPNSNTSVYNGIALGSFSEASTAAGVSGYNVNTNRTDKYAGLTDITLTSKLGAVSVGNSTMTRQITGVAAGTNDTDAVNIAQLKSVNLAFTGNTGSGDVNLANSKLSINGDNTYIKTAANGKQLTISPNVQNITLNNGRASASTGLADASNVAQAINNVVSGVQLDIIANKGTKTGSVNLSNQKLTVTGGNGIRTDIYSNTSGQNLVIGLEPELVNATTKGIGLTGDTGSTGLKYLKDGDATFKVAGDGNLVTTVGSAAGVKVSVDSTKVKDLAIEAVTVSKANTVDNPITVTPKAGTNSKEYAIGIDTTKLAAKTNLAYTANGATAKTVSLAKGLNFVNGTNTVSSVDSDGKVSFDLNQATKDSINKSATAVGRTITLNADSGTGSSQSLSNGNVSFAVSGATGDYISTTMDGSAVKVSTKRATIDSDANTGAASVTGADGLATAKNVASAINNTNTVLGNKITKNAQDIATNTSNITANKNQITTNTTNIATNTANIAHTIALADDKGASTTAKSLKDGNVSFNIKGDNKFISTAASGNDVTLTVNEQAIKDAAKSASSFKVKANAHAEEEVKGGDTITFNNGDNIEISQAGKTFTIKTAKNMTVDSLTAGNTVINTTGLTSGTGAGAVSFGTNGISAGNQVISNVASGTVNNNATDDSNAANIGDVKQAVANLSQNLNITDGTNNGTVNLKNQTLNVAGANGVTATVNNQKITVGLDADTVNATTKGIGLTGDTGSTGNKYLKDGDVSFAVTGDGNLVSTSATTAGVKVAVDAAKVKDLAVAAVTVSKDTQADNPITVTPTAGTNSKDYAIGIDTTKLAATTDLTYRANSAADANAKKVSLSKGLNFVDGGSTVATVDNDGKVSFDLNTATKNQINTNTTDIAANKGNITKNTAAIATNTAALARNISLGADAGTASSQSLSAADVAFNVKGATGDFVSTNMNGNTVEISTKRATINSNATTGEASVTGNDGLATAQNVADAINKAADAAKAGAAWNITTNSSTTDKTAVKGGDTVDLVNGDNIEITQDGTDKKKITVATKKDITVDSVTANNKVTVGSGANKITLDGTDGSVTGKAFTGTTFTGTSFTGTSFTAGNTVINTNGLTNGTTAITGTGVTTDNVTVGDISIDKTAGINAGNKVISNVASGGTTLTNAANIGDVQNAVANLSQNLNITDGTHDGTVDLKNQKLNVAGANGVTATVNNQTITVGLDADTVKATTKGIGLTADTGSTGNKYLKDGDVSFAVTGDGSLVSTSATAAGVKVAVNSASITAGTDGTITAPTTDGVTTAKNVADAINAAKKASKTEITANTGEAANATTGNVTLTSTTAADGHTIYDVKLNDKVTLGSGANAVTIDGTTGAITGKTATIGGVTVNGTANTIGGLSNTTWNGTAVSGRAATEDQLKAATGATTLKFTGDVATNTGSVNLKDDTFGIKGDGKYISTDVNGKNVNLTVSEAEVKKSAVAAVTVSTDTTDTNNPLTVTPTTSADGTTKDYKVTIDGTKIANKTNLSYKANNGTAKQVSLADGLNFKNGTLTTASIDDKGVVKYDVNTASITAGTDGTITGPATDGVATAKNVADAINAAKKASKTEITANTGEAANATTGNVTLTSTTAADGHTIYDVKLNDKVTLGTGANAVTVDGTAAKVTAGVTTVDGATGTITTGGTNSIKVDGATGTVTGLTNKDWTPGVTKAVTGRAATEDQLQKVADAASSQTWNITADKAGTTGAQTGTKKNATVGKDETVELVAGDNLTINQDERKFTYFLNKDLANLTSVSVGTGTTETIKLDGATGKITAKNAAIGGVTIDGDNNHVTGLANTTWNGTATTGRAATEDQLKAVAETAKTTTDAVNLKFSGNTNTSPGVVNLKDDTFGIVGDGKYVSTDANGKNLTVKVSEAEVKKSAVAAVTVSTDTTDANNPLTVTPTTSADGTTKDYKVTIDGTKIANKTNLSYKANDGTPKQVSLADGLNFKNGTLTTASIDDNGVVKYDVNTASITAGADGTITGPTTDGVATAQNVADAINAAKKAAKTEITANAGEATNSTKGNVTLTSTTAADGHTIYDVKLNDKVTLGSGANAVTIDGTAGKATIGSSIVDGVNSTFTTGGANAVKLDGAAGTIKTGTVTVTGGTTNDITGLSNTTVNSADFATKGRAATEEQLKAVGEQTWQITADKDATTSGAQTGTKKNAKVGKDDKVQLIAGENLTVNQNERDFTYSLNKDLVKMNSATFEATGGKTTVIKGDSIVQTDGANVNTSNATSNTITDGTNTSTITAGKAQIGTVGIDGVVSKISTGGTNAVVVNGADGTIKTGNVTVTGGTTNDITGLSNTTVTAADFATKGRAATEEQLKAATGATTLKFTGDVATNTGSVNLKDDTFGIKGDGKYISTDVNGKNVNLTISEAEVKKSAVAAVTVSTDTTDANNPLTVTPTTSADGTTKDYKVTIDGTKIANKTNLSYKANDGTAKQVSLADGLNFKNGTLTTASIDDNGVVKYDVNTASITAGADGTITGPTTDGVATAQNVADAINAAKKAAKTEITANAGEATNSTKGNVTLTSTTAADGHTIYDVKLNDKVTLGSGANAVTIDGTAGKATIGSSIVDGVNSTFTTGGANAVKLDGAAGTIKTGTVTVTGGTTNDITGLSNTTVNSADFATKGRAATEEQLKAVGEQTWQITADKDATTSGAQTGTKKNAKVGKDDKVQLIAGENLTVNQNERDFTYSLNKDLVKMNSATFEATGGRTTVIKGDSIVQTDGTKVNTSTAGGSTVADGTKSTETTADGQVIKDGAKSNKSTVDSNVIDDGNGNVNTSNATSNTITDGTNTSTVTAGKAQIGTVGIDGVASKITTGGANAVVINGADGTVKTGTVTVIGGTTNDITGLSNTTVTAADFATKGRAATEEQLKAVGEQTWQITADKDATTSGAQTGTKKDAKVGKNDKVQLIAGENMTVNQNERDFTFTLNKDLVKMNSATFEATGGKTTVIKGDSIVQTDGTKVNTSTATGNTVVDGAKSTATTADGTTVTTANGNTNYAADGVRINTTGKTPVSLTDAGLDNGNNVIKNVASGHVNNDATDNTNAANIADVKKATTTVTANAGEAANATTGNVTLTSTTAADGHTIYDVKLNDKVTLGSGANAVTIDGTAGKATFGSSVVDGVNNTFTTGGANAVKLDGAAGTIKTGTVTVTGGTTNDITGLSNTTVTAADFATKGRAATEEQLKAVGEQTWQITADKDATTSGAQTGTKKDAKVGKNDKVQLIAGENMTVNQNERDFTFTLNKDLVKMNSATFEATGGKTTVIKGDSIVQTDGTKVNTSTAGGNTVADGTKSTETTADGQVIKDGTKTNTSTVDENTLVDGAKSNKATVDSNVVDDGNGNVNTSNATSNTITDGTNRSTITAGKATIGSSVVDGVNNTFTTGGTNAVKLDGAAGTIKTGTVTVTGGTTNDITGLSNTTVNSADFATKGRAATEEQLKAVGEQTWQITADKDATTSGAQTGTKKDAKVGKNDKVQLIAGENMTVNQNERDFTFTLNKDLVKMNSATFEATGGKTTVIKGDSIVQTDGTKVNTSTAGGNTVADGTKSTETTAAGQVIKDGAKTNTSTVDENTIVDGTKFNKSTVDGNTITDGTNTTATTSSSVTVKDNAGNSTVITKDNITTGVGGNKITLDGTAGKATVGSSVVDGVNNTFTTGGTNAVKLDGAAGTIKTGTVTVTGGTTNDITGLSNTTVNSADFATKGRAATEEQLKAVGEQTWQITADKDATTSGAQTGTKKDAKVGKNDKVQLIAGENMTVNQNERDFTFTLNKDLVKMNSATFLGTGSNTTVITGNSITQTAGTQTNTSTAGGNTVADGTKSTETTAAGQVIKNGAKSNKSTVDNNVIDDGTGNVNTSNATSNTITDGTNTTATTSSSVTVKDNAGNSTVITKDNITTGVGGNKITLDGTAGKATIGASVVDGVNNTFTTGGTNAVTMNGAAGTIKTGTVTVTGGTTNDITGLSNTTVTAADFATKGRAATEEQLKAVGEQTWQITADKDATTSGAQTGTKKDAKVGKNDKVQLIAGENMTVNQNERDFTFTLNKDLVKMNSATFEATGGKTTVIKGDSIVQTDGTKVNTSTAGGNTVADGTKSTETTAAGQVIKDGAKTNTSTVDENTIVDGTKFNKSTVDGNTITDGTNTTATTSSSVTVKDNAGNSTVITKDNITTGVGGNKITLDGTAGKATVGSSVVDGVNNTFTTGGTNAVKLDGAAGTIKTGTVTVTGGTTNDITGLSNTTVNSADFATKGRAATEEQLKAVGEQTWQITADKDATTSGAQTGTKKDAKVGKNDKVQLIAGENMTVNQNERDFTFTLNKDLVKMNSATFLGTGSNTTVITGNSITQTAGTQTNTSTAGGNTVADGTKSTETTAAGQVIKDGAKSNKSTVDNNVIDDGTGNVNTSNATSNTVTDGTNTTATTSSSVTVKDNAGNSTVITKDNITTGVGGNKITLDGTAGKATVGSSVVDGVNNTFTTGGTNAVKLDGAAGTIKTGTVTVTGGTTNDITGLSNTTVNSADFATKGRAATEEQLKAVGEQTWQITADKDATTSGAQTGTKKDAKVGKNDKVQLIAGENMTVNQNERDFTFTLNKDLVKMNSATFLGTGSNTTVITGNSITQTAGTQTNTSTAAGNTIANGTKSTETTADGQVIKDGAKSNKSTVDSNVIDDGNGNVNTSNATSNTITDGTNTSTVTAGKAQIGTVGIDGVASKITTGGANAVVINGADGTVKTGTVTVIGGTTNDITGLSNTTVTAADFATKGRAATEEQLKAVGEQTWQITADKDATTSGAQTGTKKDAKVGKNDKVQLIAGENMTVNQNERDFTFTLNKDLVKMNSATFEATGGKTTVIKGDSIVQTDGGKTNTSNAAGNTVVDGNKSTATTAAGITITDGAKTNTSTADKNVINDGAGNTNVSNATSNTLKNAAGDETKSDAKGVTVKDAAGNNATFTKDGITITKTGKDTVSLTSNGLDNGKNKIVNVAAGVANTDAVNVGQLKEYAAKSTTELTANNGETAGSTKGNIVLTKTTAADGHTIYDNKLNDKITLGTDPTKAVTVDGTTGTVTGLTNKTWTPGSIVSGRAATEDQLKDAVADSGWKAAVDKEGSGQSTVVGTSPEKIKAEETVTFKAGNNMMVTQTGKSISYAVNPELTDMKSATFKDAAGNTTVTNGNGITITPGSANPTNPHAGPVSLTKDGLNNGNNQIKGVAPGTDPTDAVNVSQLNASNANTSQAINQIAGEVQHVGAHAAAMAALKPIQYDPLEPTQVMAGVGNYRGETAAALGLAHYTNENTMFNVGVSVGGNHNMVNAGVTHKFGYSPEKKNIPDRYKAGPISSVYVMQDEVSSLKKENAEQKYVIADQAARLTTLEAENEQQRRELAETKKGLDDLKAAVDKLLASKG
ncbi:YadA-like family protein [Veillonella atypica]|uniref:YadA-like family protein n=1 Tax=Veillonella atypica TaxID=39777 RepID=UPI00399254D1